MKKERLPRPLFGNQEANGRTAIRTTFNISKDGFNFFQSAYLDEMLPHTRNHPGSQGLDHGIALARPNAIHRLSPSQSSDSER